MAVLRHGDRPEVKRMLEFAGASANRPREEDKANLAPTEGEWHTLPWVHPDALWLVEKGDLILTSRANKDEVLAVRAGEQPGAFDHPLRAELAREQDGLRPAAIGFVDLAPLAAELAGFGLDGLERIELRWGFQDDALVTRLRMVAPSPRTGLASLLDQPGFSVNTLPPLPPNLTHLSVLSMDLEKAYDLIDRLLRLSDPPSPDDPPSAGSSHGMGSTCARRGRAPGR